MLKLVADYGLKWALLDNSMIFSNVVWLDESDVKRYHLIDENHKDVKFDLEKCLVKVEPLFLEEQA